MRDLPPTATLRAFEAATRHATFTSASEELHVTQSAVSHQLKHLEELWGLQLFQRGKSLALTPAGAALAPIVREFFMNLEATLTDLREQKGRVRLKVSTTYSFALKWLLPRLPGLSRLHPEILVTLETTDKAIHFSSTEPDVAIRFGNGNYPGLHSEFMFREQIFPVASPDLLARLGTPRKPAELLCYPLLTRAGADLVRPPVVESYSAKLIGEMIVSNERAISIVPSDIAEELVRVAGVAIVPYSFDWTLSPIALFRRSDGVERKADQLFAEALRAVCRETYAGSLS
ncbi:LysR substrate-binding domain-containing protein [Herbaspirillum lusitanum]|uniref:LysR substrate-binding domain-containing protein n=1 Tax=Herbaspirillum lusitanum TaxID=213312 RepID=UPI000A03B757|nr:LysR substrate-binding domain-containing protein [Herbaspirillum lusitanum]